jgi:integrase
MIGSSPVRQREGNDHIGGSASCERIRPAAAKIGITQRIRWYTFRHTYSSLLRANKTDIKVTQELLRHASSRVTLDTYTQAVAARSDEHRAA